MGKRKSDDNPATTNSDVEVSQKRQRLSDGAAVTKKAKKDKKMKKESVACEEDVVDIAMTEVEDTRPHDVKQDDSAAKDSQTGNTGAVAAGAAGAEGSTEKSKKKRKKNKKAASDQATTTGEEQGGADGTWEGDADTSETKPSKNRFIVFVGNLPFSAKVTDIEKHFSAVQPTSVRLIHEKANPTKSRGIAFLEFRGYDHMKTCLKTMHHSTFTCQGKDYRGRPKMEERKINVELTAGGGGNTEGRKEKIRAKNEKLNEERERRAAEEEKQRIKKEQERLIKGGEQRSGEDGIHPSRRGRVPGGRK